MKTFFCDGCGALVFFENLKCLTCGHALGFVSDVLDLSALDAASNDSWKALAEPVKDRTFRFCENGRAHNVCNWLVPADSSDAFCVACRLNRTIPDLTITRNRELWYKIEGAKRRLVYTLLSLKLPLTGEGNRPSLRFDFLADPPGGPPVLSAHDHGLITLNIAEADDAEREKRRVSFHEPYRTLLGHFRHESGHYYWDQLIADSPHLQRFRELFGDETQDYGTALKAYHQNGAPAGWQERLISAYASAHPWEDWAESWAHYLHMTDNIETAAGFGVQLRPKNPAAKTRRDDPWQAMKNGSDFNKLIENWLPLTHALNCLSRGMGYSDLYPFVLSTPVIEKLQFIHEVIRTAQGKGVKD